MTILRFILGLFFIVSAFTKLIPAEPFELYLYSAFEFNWSITTILARFIISLEVLLGLLICLNIYPKRTLQFTTGLLAIFTTYLFYEWIFQNEEDCMCLGEYLKLPMWLSVLKNLVFIAISIILLRAKKEWKTNLKGILLIISIVIAYSLPSILSPPDFVFDPNQINQSSTIIPWDSIEVKNELGERINLKKGKKLVNFFSMKCKFCRMTTQKLNVMHSRFNGEYEEIIIFWGKEENLETFWTETESIRFPHTILPPDEFFKYSGPSLPVTFFLKDGEVINKLGYRELDEGDIQRFVDL